MARTKEQVRAEISGTLQSQAINSLVEALAESQLKIEELTAKLAELSQDKPTKP